MSKDSPEDALRCDIGEISLKRAAENLHHNISIDKSANLLSKALKGDSPRLQAGQGIMVCQTIKRAYHYLRYHFFSLVDCLTTEELTELMADVMAKIKEKLSDKDSEILVTKINKLHGFQSPERSDKFGNLLEERRRNLLTNAYSNFEKAMQEFQEAKAIDNLLIVKNNGN